MNVKKILKVVKNVFCTIFTVIGIVASTLFAQQIINKKCKKDDRENNEDIEHEIQNTDAADIVDTSPNQDTISSTIEQQQQELRQRIRDRLKKNV